MKEVVDKLFKLREELKLKSEFPKRYSPSPSLKVHSIKSYMQTNYAWIVCDTKNQDCTIRKFTVPLKVDNAILVDKSNIVALATMPLGVIGLEKYIQFHSYHATSNTLEKLPFNIDDHPYAKSHIARQMISRLEDDIVAHAKNAKDAKTASIRGLSKTEVEETLHDKNKLKDLQRICQFDDEYAQKQKENDEMKMMAMPKCYTRFYEQPQRN